MKKRIILFFAMLATMVLLAVGLTIGASASTYDVSTADDFTTKISSAASGDTINVTADITVSTQCTIDKTLTITSNNGSTVTVGVNRLFLVGTGSTAGTLTIEGDVKFIGGSYGNIVTMVNGTATLQGSAQLKANDTPVLLMKDPMKVSSSFYIRENALIEVTADNQNAIYMTGNASLLGTVYVQGGTIRSTNGKGINMARGAIEVSGGTIEAQYPIYLFYHAETPGKTVTISGGNITGSVTGIYFHTNCKRATVTISGGTVSGGTHAIEYKADQTSSDNSITISGGTLTAPSQTVFLYRCSAVPMTVTGGTIEATTEGNTIYGAELRGDLTLGISGSPKITAATQDTIVVTMASNTSTYPGKLVATISGGKITAGTIRAINVQHGKVTVSGGEIYAGGGDTIFTNKKGADIAVTGGKIGAGDKSVFAIASGATETNLQISGGMIILGGTDETAQIIRSDVDESASCVVTVEGGKFLYGDNVKTLWAGTEADKIATTSYDLDGNGESETYYISFSIAATNVRFSGEMEKGAAVRIAEGGNGLKFTTVFSANAVTSLNNKAETGSVITYGTLILPTVRLAQLDSYDTEALIGLIGTEGCFHLIAGRDAQITTGEDGSIILQAAITDLTDGTVSYSAISYVCLSTAHETAYYFTAYNPADNARSAADVAQAAIADTDAGYTTEQIAILNGYVSSATPLVALLPKKETWL